MSFISAGADGIFYHGITMQHVAEWDSGNRSSYATCRENPRRISPSFGHAAVRVAVADTIATLATFLLEIAKYNAEVNRSHSALSFTC